MQKVAIKPSYMWALVAYIKFSVKGLEIELQTAQRRKTAQKFLTTALLDKASMGLDGIEADRFMEYGSILKTKQELS